jgi:asparagine synthase (glutamine-hydrolysing)
MAQQSSSPVKTFSIGFDERFFSETHYARQVAERYQTDHHEFLFRPEDLRRVIEGVVHATDEPLADPAALPLYELARQTRRHVTVALSGDGGDETLAGYQRYALDRYLWPYTLLPEWLTQGAIPAIVRWLPEPSWLPVDHNPVTGLKRLGNFSAVTHKASLARWGSYFTQQDKLDLYTDQWDGMFSNVNTTDWLAQAYDQAQAAKFLDCTLYADHVTYLAGDLLPKTDRTTMAHALEARAPFLDFEWVEWTACLPVKYKIRGLRTKWLLKAAFADLLPDDVSRRGKQGFSVPVGFWLRNELHDWASELLLDSPGLAEWFRRDKIEILLAEHQSGRINHGKRLWALLLFSLWLGKK